MEIEPLRLTLFIVSDNQPIGFFRGRSGSVLLQLTLGFALRLFSLLLLASALLLSFSKSGARVSGHGYSFGRKLTIKPNAVATPFSIIRCRRLTAADRDL